MLKMNNNVRSFLNHVYKTFDIQCVNIITHTNTYFYINQNANNSNTLFVFFPNSVEQVFLNSYPIPVSSANPFYRNIKSLCSHYASCFNYTFNNIVLFRNDIYLSNDSIHYICIIRMLNDDGSFRLFHNHPLVMKK